MLPAYRSLCASTRRFALQPPLPRTSRFSTVASCTSCSRLQSLSICPNIPSRQPSSKFQTRPFSQSTSRALRPTYFPNNAGGNPKGNGFFSNLKRTINDLPSSVILWTIIGLNGAVYVVYNIGYSSYQSGDPSILIALRNNFTLSLRNWREGRFWTTLTSCFTHEQGGHIIMNLFTFYFMAPPVLGILGNASFLGLYLGAGIISGLATLLSHNIRYGDRRPPDVVGASGAIYGIISFMACASPRSTFLIFGIIPLPAWLFVGGVFAYDMWSSATMRQTNTSHITHVMGLLTGIAYFVRLTGRFPRL